MALLCQNNLNFRACNYWNNAITLKYMTISYHDTIFSKENLALDKNKQATPLFSEGAQLIGWG